MTDQIFGDLDSIGGCTLAEIVGNDPAIQGIRIGIVPSQPTDEDLIAIVGQQGHGILEGSRIIQHPDAGSVGQK